MMILAPNNLDKPVFPNIHLHRAEIALTVLEIGQRVRGDVLGPLTAKERKAIREAKAVLRGEC